MPPKNKYCLKRPDGKGGSKQFCMECSVDEELKVIEHYIVCAKAADCPSKYKDKPVWNAKSRLCEACDPGEHLSYRGCIDTGSVRHEFAGQRLSPLNCTRGVKDEKNRRCICPPGWASDYSQSPFNFTWCEVMTKDHPYMVRRRLQAERSDHQYSDYFPVLLVSVIGIIMSYCLVVFFFSLLRKLCRQIRRECRPSTETKHQVARTVA